MLKGVLLVCVSTLIVGAALLGYHSLPEGLQDPYKVNIIMKAVTLVRSMGIVGQYLGYGSMYSNLWKLQKFESTRDPVSATYGDLKVTKDILSGVPVIIYQPLDTSKLYPAIVWFHGGGWTLGGVDLYDKTVYDYANQTGTVVVSVGYRLAPQHPFPAPLQDCFDVTTFVLRHGAKYNVDVTKVGLAGDSAGGNLAVAVNLKLLQETAELPPLLFQVLHYPGLQAFNMHLPSYVDYNQTMPLLTLDIMSCYYAYYMGLDVENMEHYVKVISENRHIPPHIRKTKYAEYVDVKLLPDVYQKPRKSIPAITSPYDEELYDKIKHIVTDPLFSPLMSPDLAALPPTLIHICEFDILRDDGFLLAKRLQDAGVQVQVHFGKGGYHADILKIPLDFLQSSSGKTALSEAYRFIKGILEQNNL